MNLRLYRVAADYCDFLRKSDPCVPYTQAEKATRPFIGVLLTVNGFDYFAPLTSPKPKHLNMKNQVDFLRINGGRWGAINFNNMIPIHSSCVTVVDVKISPSDAKPEIDYKNLLANQLSWCNSNKSAILVRAAKLYHLIVSKQARPELRDRCCDFPKDEEQYQIWRESHE